MGLGEDNLFEDTRITGTEVNYYFVCKRKLWFFTHNIQMEHNSDRVYMGRVLHEDSFKRENKEILIDGTIKLDFINKHLEIHETKMSKAVENASYYQLLYYLYYLDIKGIKDITGYIHYPKSRHKEEVFLTDENKKEMEQLIKDIIHIKQMEKPPELEPMKICKKCSYYDLCYC